jgi:hypothetical protein
MPDTFILLVIIVVGALLWLVNAYFPMGRKVRQLLNGVVVIVLTLWLLSAFGVWNLNLSIPSLWKR